MSPEAKTKSVWENRFARPKAADLLAEIPKPTNQLLEGLRATLKDTFKLSESVAWQGIPWRWSFVLTLANGAGGGADGTGGAATGGMGAGGAGVGVAVYLIPCPTKVEVAMCFSDATHAALLSKKQAKTLRETLTAAATVGNRRFARWELAGKAQVDEIVGLLEQVIRPAEGSKAEGKGDHKPGSKR